MQEFETIYQLSYGSEIATVIEGDLPIAKYTEEEKTWGDVVTAAAFLPRVQLYGGNSGLVQEGKIKMGHFGLTKSKDQTDDLGSSFDCLVLSWRFKAMEINGETIISVYNPKSTEFVRIQGKADIADSGCMFGIEFLLWIPIVNAFGTYFLNSKTARRVAPDLKGLLKQGATIKSNLIVKGKYKWHGPVVTQCSTPFEELPDSQEILEQATRFANPKESELEKAEPAQSSRPQ